MNPSRDYYLALIDGEIRLTYGMAREYFNVPNVPPIVTAMINYYERKEKQNG